MQSHPIQLYWSFRSPYSYLATRRLRRIADIPGVQLDLKIVLPLAVRNKRFFKDVNPLWLPYLIQDTKRIAEMEQIPYGLPEPDPIQVDPKTFEAVDDQPYIFRLCRLGIESVRQGCGLPFIDEVSRLIWSGQVKGWDQGDHLAQAAARAGLDLARMDAAIEAEPQSYDHELEKNQQALEKAGHWGVPTMAFDGEVFFGQDRIDHLLWRLVQHGVDIAAAGFDSPAKI